MILERSMHPKFLSNTFLVAAEPGGEAFFVDAGGPLEPLFEKVAEHDLTPTHVLLTHHHYDHVSEVPQILERWPDVQVLIHPAEKDLVETATGTMDAGETVRAGGLDVQTLHIPGHTAGMLGLLVNGNVFTGDTLFKKFVGGVRAPGSTSYADLKSSVMDTLMALAAGHGHPARPHGSVHRRTRVREQHVHPPLARPGLRRRRAGQGAWRARHPDPARRRLRRRPQGLGPLARRSRRHRARQQD